MAQLNTRPYLTARSGGAHHIRVGMFKVYIIYSRDFDRYYVGMTDNMDVRLKQHNSKKTRSTKAFVPWEVVHVEKYLTRTEAREREKYLKSAAGRRWRKSNIRPRGATEYPPVPNGTFGRGASHSSWNVQGLYNL